MSPRETMNRVYKTLKIQIGSGAFEGGERLDPTRLALELSASTTPVRDALHRLVGEGLVDSSRHDGFRTPLVTEATMRDRYEWSSELLATIVRAAFRHGVRAAEQMPLDTNYPTAAAQTFQAIAGLSPSFEHRREMVSLIDRTATYRLAERDLLPAPEKDLFNVMHAVESANPQALRQALEHFHRRRLRAVTSLAARLREYPLSGS